MNESIIIKSSPEFRCHVETIFGGNVLEDDPLFCGTSFSLKSTHGNGTAHTQDNRWEQPLPTGQPTGRRSPYRLFRDSD